MKIPNWRVWVIGAPIMAAGTLIQHWWVHNSWPVSIALGVGCYIVGAFIPDIVVRVWR